jgi:uncharacterized membrane protein YoaK (UPF0700 family)
MIRYQRRFWVVAACLSAIAGFVDAVAFVQLGGFFVSFMSGNSTRLGVGLAAAAEHAWIAGGLIASFVLGVLAGAFANRRGDTVASVRVVLLVAAALALAASTAAIGATAASVALLAGAMGATNAVFRRDGEVGIGVTYMTGALVKLGQRLAEAVSGGPAFGWAPYALLWMGLVAGATAGAFAFGALGLGATWIAAGATLLVALVLSRVRASVT